MTRIVALRASALFVALTLVFAGVASQAAVATALSLITGSVCALMLLFAAAQSQHAAVPVRVRGARR
jgi:hypothetical protein